MSTRNTLVSGILVLASPINGVNTLALAPEHIPAKPQCHGIPTSCLVTPSITKGLNLLVTHALSITGLPASLVFRAEYTFTSSPLLMPFAAASSSLISIKGSGMSWHCVGVFLVHPPPCQCSV